MSNETNGVVLLYHRVNRLKPDPWNLAVTPEHFAEQLESIRALTDVQPLSKMQEQGIDRVFSCITFDDGYADNFDLARPILEEHDLPATVFVSSGFVGSERELWWDVLDRLFLQGLRLPPALEIEIRGRVLHFEVADSEGHEPQDWDWDDSDFTTRHTAYRALFEALRPLNFVQQQECITKLEEWAGSYANRPERLMMSREKLEALSRNPLFEIGAHTVTHPVLSLLSGDTQRLEIAQSKCDLEEICGYAVNAFAYPNGGSADYTEETARIVLEAGFGCACSAFEGVVTPATDRYEIPRMMVRDWDGDTFSRVLRQTLQRRSN